MNPLKKNNAKLFGASGKTTLVFAHGYGCDQSMWRLVVPDFEADYQILTFDHVGSGGSDEASYDFDKYNNLSGYATDIIELLEYCQLTKVVFVGHSVSAIIGALVAIKRPDLMGKLIMIGPSPCYINKGDYFGGFDEKDIHEMIDTLESNYLGWSSYITPVIVGRPDKPEFADELNKSFCTNNPEIAKHFAKVTFMGDNRADLSKVTVDTLIVQTSPDIIAPERVGKYVHEQIVGSDYHLIESAGHCPHLTAPEKTIRIIKDFI